VLEGSQVNEAVGGGIQVIGKSSLYLDSVSLDANTGIALVGSENSAIILLSTLSITNTADSFSILIAESSSLTFRSNSQATITDNLFGVQITSSSSFDLESGSSLSVTGNELIGISVNVGASMTLFRSNVVTSSNGLDGASITLGATLFVDQTASFIANNNGRDGIRMEEAILRMNNLGTTLGPLVETNNNVRRGMSVGRNSILDLQATAPIRGLQSTGNSQSPNAGGDLWVDYSSSVSLRSSTVGLLVAGFYSLLDTASSTVSTVVCTDSTVRTRGTITCPPPIFSNK